MDYESIKVILQKELWCFMLLIWPNNQKLMLQDHLASNIVDEDSRFEYDKTKQTKYAKQ